MRQKRAKSYRKLMAQYERHFGFRQPYQVLVNADFCELAIQLKMDFMKEIETVFQAKVKPMITQCCITSLYKLGPPGQRIVDLAKTFERRRCGHLETPLAPDECIVAVVGETNKHRYAVATQSESLRRKMRDVEGVPVVALNRAVMVLETMSEKSKGKIRAMEEEMLAASKEEVAALKPALKAAEKALEGERPPAAPVVKKKKPKAPNPLSVRKKKTKAASAAKPTVGEKESPVRLGKRGREDEQPAGGQHDAEDAAGRKRRKRRRKHKSGEDNGTVAGGDTEGDSE